MEHREDQVSESSPRSLALCAAACGVATAVLVPVDAWMLRGVIAEHRFNLDKDPDGRPREMESGGVGMVFFATMAVTILVGGIGIACVVQLAKARSRPRPE